MKPCNKNRKPIAWPVAGALDARRARELRAHFETCEHCRGYWNEMSRLTERLVAAEPGSRIEAGPAFHPALMRKLRATQAQSIGGRLSEYLGGIVSGWRVAIPATAALALAALLLTTGKHGPAVSPPPQASAVDVQVSPLVGEFSPTMANYEMAANESLDKLDELLTRQGNRLGAPSPTYTASMLKTPGAAE